MIICDRYTIYKFINTKIIMDKRPSHCFTFRKKDYKIMPDGYFAAA